MVKIHTIEHNTFSCFVVFDLEESWRCAKCRKTESVNMICCDECDKWFHLYVFLIEIDSL